MKKIDLLESCWVEPIEVGELRAGFGYPAGYPMWESYIGMRIHPDMLTVLYRVIFPVFVEMNGCVLLEFKMEGYRQETILKFIKESSTPRAFESDFNFLRVCDLFSNVDVKHEESFETAALLLKKSWEMSLQLAFPNRLFEVVLSNSDFGPAIELYSV